MKINFHLLRLVEQICQAKSNGNEQEEFRLREHAIKEIVRVKFFNWLPKFAEDAAVKNLDFLIELFYIKE